MTTTPCRGPAQRRWPRTLAAAALVLGAAAVPAQEAPPRPRLGLALGGGSARGFAHVGVLRWLEEHHVPVDAVAGTSMGALIGGSYATGLSADEIEQELRQSDWDLMLAADAPYRLKELRRKEDAREYPVKLELGLKHGLALPSGLNPGHHIGTFLSRIALPYSGLASFDELPIPFRCVATDMRRAESVTLDRGPLDQALRASMAIPGVFDPVRDGERLYSDGGILNNVPVDVARAMGVDVVVAVKVGSPDFDPVSESLFGLVDRAVVLMMDELDQSRLAQADLVILPALAGVGGTDYRRHEEIARLGYEAAAAQAERLLPFALDEAAWQAHLAARQARRRLVPRGSAFLEVAGLPEDEAERLRRQLDRSLGSSLEPDRLEAALNRVVGTGRHAAASYGLMQRDGATGLRVTVREKTHAPPFLNLSVDLSNEREDVNFGLGARATLTDLTGPGSELRLEGALGVRQALAGEWLQPLGSRGAFVAPRAFADRERDDVYAEDAFVASYRSGRAGAGADLGWLFPVGQLRLGYEAAHLRLERRIGDEQAYPDVQGPEQLARAVFDTDTRDQAYFARKGVRLQAALRWYLDAPRATADFGQLTGGFVASFPGPGKDRAYVSGEGGAAIGGARPSLYDLTLGGPFRLSAFNPDQFRGLYTALGRAGYLRSLARLPSPVADRLYLVVSLELGSAFEQLDTARVRWSASAGLVADTFLGPSFVGLAVGNGGAFKFYFALGRLLR